MAREATMSGARLPDWRYSVFALLGLNLTVPLVIGGLIAVAETGDPIVLMCGGVAVAMLAGIEVLRRRHTTDGLRAEATTPLNESPVER